MRKKCDECNRCGINDDMTNVIMSSADWQRNEQRHLRREKRFIAIIVLLVVLLVGSNMAWLIYENQFEIVEEITETITTTYENIEQTTNEGGNNFIGGDYVNGETENR